ncbi:MAG: metal-dependent hydrolase [Epsilonproteobacteria bacterium]|nr:metal-dependent hydrolase [Campylobacterota bacterium]
MTIIEPTYTYIDNKFHENRAVAFSKTIEAIDSIENLKTKYPDADIIKGEENSILYPGFINTHVHLEFSANKTTLQYGNFMSWLDSVIANRDRLIQECDNEVMLKACSDMLESGVTTFGAISSFGKDLETCAKTPQKVIYFNEIIGSNMAYVDALYSDFLNRLDESKKMIDSGVTPAIAIHSPYSVHPVVLKRAINIAKDEKLPLSAHLLESPAEREWLESGEGEFLSFFQKYFNTSTPVTTISEFIESFDDIDTHFTHMVQATNKELEYIAQKGHSIAHCPRSNRLLGCGRLDIDKLIELDIPFSVATDGLSSNSSLNIFDELRATLMLHYSTPLRELSNLLIKNITSTPAKILGVDSGEIKESKSADLVLINLPDRPNSLDDIALQTILHTQKVDRVFIDGKEI